MDRFFRRGEALPSVSLYELSGSYFILDGHHRVSVARFHGVEWIDAEVTEFRARLGKRRRGGGAKVSHEKRGSGTSEMIDSYEVIRQRREEMAREAQQNRLAKELRRSRGRRAGLGDRPLSLSWELRRIAGRLSKLFGSSRNPD